jgi:hypothetical protein
MERNLHVGLLDRLKLIIVGCISVAPLSGDRLRSEAAPFYLPESGPVPETLE